MQKIVLSQNTLGVVIDRLRKVTSGIYSYFKEEDVNPLRFKSWSDPIMQDCTACAKITPHCFIKRNYSFLDVKLGDPGFPLIHMAFNAEYATVFVEGDVFYFKGNTIIVNNTSGTHIKIRECLNIVTKITCHKKRRDLDEYDLFTIQERKDYAEASAREWERIMEEDMVFF